MTGFIHLHGVAGNDVVANVERILCVTAGSNDTVVALDDKSTLHVRESVLEVLEQIRSYRVGQ